MSVDSANRLIALAWQEWRRFRFSPIWLIGVACAALLSLNETGSSDVLGYPTANHALYGFQLGVSVVFGFIAFLLASGSLALDLEPSRKSLIFSRPVGRVEFLLAKFMGVFSLTLAAIVPVLVLCLATPVLHGTLKLQNPGPFISVLVLCSVPMVAYATALALALTAIFTRVILVLPLFVMYFFAAALLHPASSNHLSFFDFSQRLYPRELVVNVPLSLREYTFNGLLSPASTDLLARSGMYLVASAALLGCAWLALHLNLQLRLSNRWLHFFSLRKGAEHFSDQVGSSLKEGALHSQKPSVPVKGTSSLLRLRNELTLLGYSARMLVGRNLLATGMILAGLLFLVFTYKLGPTQTRSSVLLLQLELFAPLLGIVMFSDLVAVEFEARRADLLRASLRGAVWVVRRKLVHGLIFSSLACWFLLSVLRLTYTRFDVLQALAIVLPGVLFFGMVGLLAASAARRALVGYAVGTTAMVLSLGLKQLEPLTATSYSARSQLANGQLLNDWNWLVAKCAFVLLTAVLVGVVLRLSARPEMVRRSVVVSVVTVLATYIGLHVAWSPGNRPPGANGTTADLEVRQAGDERVTRQVVVTQHRRLGHVNRWAELVDVQSVQHGGAWQIQRRTPVDLTRELQVPHLDLDVYVDPVTAQIEGRAQFRVRVLQETAESVRFYLASELAVHRIGVEGRAVEARRFADLVDIRLPQPAERGQELKIDVDYAGKLELPQNLGFEGAAKDFLFATARWYPCLRGTRPGVRPLFTCSAKIRTPPQFHVAAAQLLSRSEREATFLWESGRRVEWVPLCVGTFKVYEKPYRDGIGLSFCTFSADEEYAQRMLAKTATLMRRYEAEFGPYPFRHAAIVENRFQGSGGAAFSSIVTIKPERLVPEHTERFASAYLPHELAHLWFGNTMPPWVAESSAVYATYRCLEAEKGKASAIQFLDTEFYPALTAPETTAAPLMKAEGALKYTKGVYLLKMLADAKGHPALISGLREYCAVNAQFTRFDPDDQSESFIALLKKIGGPELHSFVEDLTRSVKRFDPAVTRVRQSDSGARIDLQHFGEMRFPVPVIVRFADGTSQALVWSGQDEKGSLTASRSAAVTSAEIDPEHNLLDWNRGNNRAVPGVASPGGQDNPNLAGWRTFTLADGLPDMNIRSLARTREAVYAAAWSLQAALAGHWAVGTVRGESWEPYSPKAEPVHLVTCMAAGPDSFWFGSQNHVRWMTGETPKDWFLADIRRGGAVGVGAFYPNPHGKDGPPGSRIYSLLVDHKGRAWVGTDRGLTLFSLNRLPNSAGAAESCRLQTVPGVQGREVFALAEDDKGVVWVGTDKGLFKVLSDRSATPVQGPADLVLGIGVGGSNEVWCGTFRTGLWRLSDNFVTAFSHRNAPLPDTIFSCVCRDGQGRVWAGSCDGLVEYDGTRWRVYTTKNSGLPANRVQCLAIDSDDRVWLGTESGLVRFTPP